MDNSRLIRGSSIMAMAIGVTKFLGVISIVPINLLLGNTGQGLYSTAYNLYMILMVLATSGLTTALSKLIAERTCINQDIEIEQLYRVTMKLVSSFAVVGALLIWFGAPFYASLVTIHATSQQNREMTLSIRALAPAILVVPLESALRGYLQGFQEVKGPALSQAVEQLFRVVVAVFGTLILVRSGRGIAEGAAAATFGAFVGAVAGLVVLWLAIIPLRQKIKQKIPINYRFTNNKGVRRILYSVALPICLGSLVVPISSNVDSLTVVNLLMHFAGQSFVKAQASFGILSRQAQNLVQLPLAFTLAVGFSVMPAISEARSLNNKAVVEANIISPIRMMFFVTFPSAVVFLTLARPIEYVLSDSYDGATIISTISFMCIFSSMELMSTYILQGLGNFYRPVRNMFIGVALKTALNVVLIILFKSVFGAAIATILGYVISSTLNILTVRKYSGIQFSIFRLAAPFLIASLPLLIELVVLNYILTYIGSSMANHWIWIWNVIQLLVSVVTGCALYLYVSIRMRVLRLEQLKSLPLIGTTLSKWTIRTKKQDKDRV